MSTSDLLYLIAVISGGVGTFCLGIIAWLSIRQTKNIQKAEKKERLLNEIIEWATDVAKCGIEPGTPDLSDDKEAAKSWPFLDTQYKKLDGLQLLRVESVSIGSIALKIGADLRVAVNDSVDSLKKQIGSLYEYKKFVDEHKNKKGEEKIDFLTSMSKHVDNNNKLLYNSAIKVIEEATKIKTKDIG